MPPTLKRCATCGEEQHKFVDKLRTLLEHPACGVLQDIAELLDKIAEVFEGMNCMQ